jgi:hypothetical protein
MIVSINKETGFVIESQPYASEDILIQNAVSSGFSAENIEVKNMTEEELQTLLESQRESRMTYAQKRKAEYPSVQDLVVALYDTEDKIAIDIKRAEIKLKYPKP